MNGQREHVPGPQGWDTSIVYRPDNTGTGATEPAGQYTFGPPQPTILGDVLASAHRMSNNRMPQI